MGRHVGKRQSVTVTASRADGLVARGAVPAASGEAAPAANELVVLSMTDYDAVYAVPEQAPDALRGRVVANLSSLRARPGRGRKHGISAAEFLPCAQSTAASLPNFYAFYAPRIDVGEHPGDVDRLTMGVAGVDHIVHATRDSGIDTTLPGAVLDVFRRAVEDGHAKDSFTSVIDVFRKRAA